VTAALELTDVSKYFGATRALVGVALRVEPGSFLGLVGPNGAGKTTLVSIAVGLLRPDAGAVRVCGHDLRADPEAAKAVLGVLPEGLGLPGRLTGRELLTYLGLLRGLPVDVVTRRTEEVLAVLDLERAEQTLIADYSTGMTKKIGLAAALLHDPRLLVLDEPLEAIDPVSAMTIRAILQGYTAAGGTVVCSSHVMALVEQICDQVAVLADGHVVAVGTTEVVRNGHSLEESFASLIGAPARPARLSWLGS
jgi:ABC-2 type transport system ATP-binding protein